MTQRVFVDANVLVSRTIRDWLFHLRRANEGMFQLYSTLDVLVEALHAIRKRNPHADGRLLHKHQEKLKACLDEVLETFPGTDDFTGTDKDDYHVHAAAVGARADILLTDNDPTDFTSTPDAEPYEIYSADDFFLLVIRSNPRCLLPCVHSQLDYWGPQGHGQLDDRLAAAGCPKFAGEVRAALRSIALGS